MDHISQVFGSDYADTNEAWNTTFSPSIYHRSPRLRVWVKAGELFVMARNDVAERVDVAWSDNGGTTWTTVTGPGCQVLHDMFHHPDTTKIHVLYTRVADTFNTPTYARFDTSTKTFDVSDDTGAAAPWAGLPVGQRFTGTIAARDNDNAYVFIDEGFAVMGNARVTGVALQRTAAGTWSRAATNPNDWNPDEGPTWGGHAITFGSGIIKATGGRVRAEVGAPQGRVSLSTANAGTWAAGGTNTTTPSIWAPVLNSLFDPDYITAGMRYFTGDYPFFFRFIDRTSLSETRFADDPVPAAIVPGQWLMHGVAGMSTGLCLDFGYVLLGPSANMQDSHDLCVWEYYSIGDWSRTTILAGSYQAVSVAQNGVDKAYVAVRKHESGIDLYELELTASSGPELESITVNQVGLDVLVEWDDVGGQPYVLQHEHRSVSAGSGFSSTESPLDTQRYLYGLTKTENGEIWALYFEGDIDVPGASGNSWFLSEFDPSGDPPVGFVGSPVELTQSYFRIGFDGTYFLGTRGSDDNNVYRINPADGTVHSSFAGKGTTSNAFFGVAAGGGKVFVLEGPSGGASRTIRRYSLSGTFEASQTYSPSPRTYHGLEYSLGYLWMHLTRDSFTPSSLRRINPQTFDTVFGANSNDETFHYDFVITEDNPPRMHLPVRDSEPDPTEWGMFSRPLEWTFGSYGNNVEIDNINDTEWLHTNIPDFRYYDPVSETWKEDYRYRARTDGGSFVDWQPIILETSQPTILEPAAGQLLLPRIDDAALLSPNVILSPQPGNLLLPASEGSLTEITAEWRPIYVYLDGVGWLPAFNPIGTPHA